MFTKCIHGCKTPGGQPSGFQVYRTYQSHMVSMHPDQEVMNEDKTFNSHYPKQSSTTATPTGKTTYSEDVTMNEDKNEDKIRIKELEVLMDKLKLKVEKLEKKLVKKDKKIADLEDDGEEKLEKLEKTPSRRSIFGPFN